MRLLLVPFLVAACGLAQDDEKKTYTLDVHVSGV